METPPSWKALPTARADRDLQRLPRRHPREHAALLRNLSRYLGLLDAAPHARLIRAGFLHPEPGGVLAIDERGGGPGLRAMRLYTFADARTRTLHLLLIGDKDSQHADLRTLPTLLRELNLDSLS